MAALRSNDDEVRVLGQHEAILLAVADPETGLVLLAKFQPHFYRTMRLGGYSRGLLDRIPAGHIEVDVLGPRTCWVWFVELIARVSNVEQ
ncbi:hypothetical protein SNOG_11220 [Parastagonospora nodorum SN15]|uniref:Uncharacterized protein n=1 Tax=Phaeosphaeria nodorum (strain SN15 / ATCC MYA-4574 / FGSC 10173) TaxID=321614 RepID=Q0UAJ4_PHANO|nr:hypothetical protein SNOG_11220 [Parastagonospora nodorum SN15]EAT81719.1 hypothetical protein SNOG_11220 [Parastagonospora nodorum SN15]